MLVYGEADIKEDWRSRGRCKGLVYSSPGLVYSDRTNEFLGLAQYKALHYTVKLPRMVVYYSEGILGMGFASLI